MVPKIAKRGGSFKGAAAYYLHDKGAATNSRVAFCQTENLPVAEPELAWRWMAYTAKHADILKQDAGVGATGRKMSKPVYTLSLSWSPEEAPSQAEMIEAAQSALKALGLSKCQTLLVAHNDEPHPHIHALVNLVDPDTGKVRDPGMDKRKLSRWAEAYEKSQGKVRCEQRVENNARRDRGEPARDTASLTRQDIEQVRQIEKEILRARREELWKAQQAEREALKRDAAERAKAVRAQLKERYRPQWAALFKKQRQDTRDVAKARRSVLAAMRVAIKERRRLVPEGRAGIGTILAYTISARALGDALKQAGERELAELRERMNEDRRQMVAAIWADYRRDDRALRDEQAEARRAGPPAEAADDIKRRAELEAALRQREQAARRAEEQQDEAARREAEQREEAAQREAEQKRHQEEKARRDAELDRQREKSAGREAEQKWQQEQAARQEADRAARQDPARPERRVRLELPEPGDSTEPPAPDEAALRREALKAEFRRQADEITRRRKERHKKDRDRDRER